jgi:exopolysaccharide biosynthesis polyprenyl glycosylphosphotransferase
MLQRKSDHAELVLNAVQAALDALACVLGFYIAFLLYRDTSLLVELKGAAQRTYTPHFSDYSLVLAGYVALVLTTFAIKHLYQSRETGLMNMDEATHVLQALVFASGVVVIGNYIFIDQKETGISRLIVGVGLVAGNILVLIARAMGYRLRRYLQARGHFFRRVLICGAGECGRTIARKLLHSPKFHILPVVFLDDNKDLHGTGVECLTGHEPVPVHGAVSRLEEAVEKYEADEVWIAITKADEKTITDIAKVTGELGMPCRFVPNLYQLPLETLSVDALGGVPLISIKQRPLIQPIPFWKRSFDIVFSLLVIVGTIWLWPFIALIIKLSSRGPVIFKQQRIGLGGRPFMMYKFRTMHFDAPAYATTPQHSSDPRITKIGRILRKLSVDELPQFLNVLIGDMSVVGPRPEMPQIVALYSPVQRQRLCVKPGITGIWQISADRKNPIHENIDYDLYYIEKQSFFLDITIILTTGVYGARGV